jgi:uncharacterized protein YybS (DUF2232 family)
MTYALAAGFLVVVAVVFLVITNAAIWLGLWRGWAPRYCIAAGILVLLALAAGLIAWVQLTSGHNLWLAWQHEFNKSLNTSLALYRQLGVADADLQRSAHWIRLLFIDAVVGWLVLLIMAIALVCYLIQRQLAPALAGSKIILKPLVLWSVPEYMIWPMLAAMILLWWGRAWGPMYFQAGLNAAVVLGNLYFIGGLAIVLFHLERWRVSKLVQPLVVALVGLFPTLIVVLMSLGIINTWWDWRMIKPNQSSV